MTFDFRFRHAGVVLKNKRRNRRAVLFTAADTREGNKRTDVAAIAGQRSGFSGNVNRRIGDENGHAGIILFILPPCEGS
jgi:hypothetical protein